MINLLPPNHPRAKRRHRAHHWRRWVLWGIGLALGLYILAAAAVFLAVNYHVTDVAGTIDPNTPAYNDFAARGGFGAHSLPYTPTNDEAANEAQRRAIVCRLDALDRQWPLDADRVRAALKDGVSYPTIAHMLFAVQLRLPVNGVVFQSWSACDDATRAMTLPPLSPSTVSIFPWLNTSEWSTVSTAFTKDVAVVTKVSGQVGVPARLIVAVAMVEQLRLYFTEREVFEKIFQPLKILGNATQFAWGIMAIKEATAIDIEQHLADRHSPWYLGPGAGHALDYQPGADMAKARFTRLTDEHNHYYSYLYGALELRQFLAQWQRSGYPIDARPEILATLFNIGFGHSHPSATPNVGGSTLTIASTEYTFGGLAYEWYYSGAMRDVFPYPKTAL